MEHEMEQETVAVELPRPLFQRLERVARSTHRSVEEILATTLNATLPENSDLPAELADQLAAMVLFSDDALWAATASSLSQAQQRRLEQLIHKGKERRLSRAEKLELDSLMDEYDRAVLKRAKALAVLSSRGFELPLFDRPANGFGDVSEKF